MSFRDLATFSVSQSIASAKLIAVKSKLPYSLTTDEKRVVNILEIILEMLASNHIRQPPLGCLVIIDYSSAKRAL